MIVFIIAGVLLIGIIIGVVLFVKKNGSSNSGGGSSGGNTNTSSGGNTNTSSGGNTSVNTNTNSGGGGGNTAITPVVNTNVTPVVTPIVTPIITPIVTPIVNNNANNKQNNKQNNNANNTVNNKQNIAVNNNTNNGVKNVPINNNIIVPQQNILGNENQILKMYSIKNDLNIQQGKYNFHVLQDSSLFVIVPAQNYNFITYQDDLPKLTFKNKDENKEYQFFQQNILHNAVQATDFNYFHNNKPDLFTTQERGDIFEKKAEHLNGENNKMIDLDGNIKYDQYSGNYYLIKTSFQQNGKKNILHTLVNRNKFQILKFSYNQQNHGNVLHGNFQCDGNNDIRPFHAFKMRDIVTQLLIFVINFHLYHTDQKQNEQQRKKLFNDYVLMILRILGYENNKGMIVIQGDFNEYLDDIHDKENLRLQDSLIGIDFSFKLEKPTIAGHYADACLISQTKQNKDKIINKVSNLTNHSDHPMVQNTISRAINISYDLDGVFNRQTTYDKEVELDKIIIKKGENDPYGVDKANEYQMNSNFFRQIYFGAQINIGCQISIITKNQKYKEKTNKDNLLLQIYGNLQRALDIQKKDNVTLGNWNKDGDTEYAQISIDLGLLITLFINIYIADQKNKLHIMDSINSVVLIDDNPENVEQVSKKYTGILIVNQITEKTLQNTANIDRNAFLKDYVFIQNFCNQNNAGEYIPIENQNFGLFQVVNDNYYTDNINKETENARGLWTLLNYEHQEHQKPMKI